MAATSVSFEIETLHGGAGLRLAGELDLMTAPRLQEALSDLNAPTGVSLDLCELTFIDSSGCQVLTRYARERPLRIVNASGAVARSLDLMGFAGHPGIELDLGGPPVSTG